MFEFIAIQLLASAVIFSGVVLFEQYIAAFFEKIILPLAGSAYNIINALLSYMKIKSFQGLVVLNGLIHQFKQKIGSIKSTHFRKTFNQVEVTTKVYIIENNKLIENGSNRIININELPADIKNKLIQRNLITIDHTNDLINEVNRR